MEPNFRKMLRAKIHRATVTHADLHYEGSITIPSELLEAADLLEHESVHVWNVTNGARFETYTVKGEAQSGTICINGAAAHHANPGDIVIIAAFGFIEERAARRHTPRVVFVDGDNQIKELRAEVPGPDRPVLSV